MDLPHRVHLTDVTLRDGLQNEDVILSTPQKLELLAALEAAGLTDFEVTSFVARTRVPQLNDAEELLARIHRRAGHRYAALVLNPIGLERARRSAADDVVLVVSATDGHSVANVGKRVADVLSSFDEMLEPAAKDRFRIRIAISTVFGCPFDGLPSLDSVLRLVDWFVRRGVTDMTLCDTVGWAEPVSVLAVFGAAKAAHPEVTFRAHLHDTGELGLANALAAMQAGVSSFDVSAGGLGGCPFAPGAKGNLASEKLVAMLDAMGIETGVSLRNLRDAAAIALRLVDRQYQAVPSNWRSILTAAPAPALGGRR